jgi:hypothetical protein
MQAQEELSVSEGSLHFGVATLCSAGNLNNEPLPRKQRRPGRRIYGTIQNEGCAGRGSTVRGHLARRRQTKKRRKVYLPLESDPGTDGQANWGDGMAIIAAAQVKVQLYFMRLCHSRQLFMMALPNQKQ